MPMVERAFVTGACGFIGKHLVERLLADGIHVTIYDRKEQNQFPTATYCRGDVVDQETLDLAMFQAAPTIVYHLAALADVRNALKVPGQQVQQNFLATVNVLEAMRAADVKRIVFTSSAVVYGDTLPSFSRSCQQYGHCPHVPSELTELGMCFPKQTSIYGAMKLASEALIEAYCVGYGMRADIFRLVSLVGEGYRHGNLMDFYRKLKTDPTQITLLGSGTQQKYYCYVGDFIDALSWVQAYPHDGAELWNVSHGSPNIIEDSLDAVCECLDIHPARLYQGESWAGDLPSLVLDCSKLCALGWAPKVSIEDGMRRTVRWMMEQNL